MGTTPAAVGPAKTRFPPHPPVSPASPGPRQTTTSGRQPQGRPQRPELPGPAEGGPGPAANAGQAPRPADRGDAAAPSARLRGPGAAPAPLRTAPGPGLRRSRVEPNGAERAERTRTGAGGSRRPCQARPGFPRVLVAAGASGQGCAARECGVHSHTHTGLFMTIMVALGSRSGTTQMQTRSTVPVSKSSLIMQGQVPSSLSRSTAPGHTAPRSVPYTASHIATAQPAKGNSRSSGHYARKSLQCICPEAGTNTLPDSNFPTVLHKNLQYHRMLVGAIQKSRMPALTRCLCSALEKIPVHLFQESQCQLCRMGN